MQAWCSSSASVDPEEETEWFRAHRAYTRIRRRRPICIVEERQAYSEYRDVKLVLKIDIAEAKRKHGKNCLIPWSGIPGDARIK
ncbi:unnamed protein product [Pieris brassicae]|uniref:Uncharacterized protein n=1 Tax=Pieris brassicae TaxID=7116 RepID=A0A9P0XJP4_PIEBR|nr:unnamed protein product [Pieris brassicae]